MYWKSVRSYVTLSHKGGIQRTWLHATCLLSDMSSGKNYPPQKLHHSRQECSNSRKKSASERKKENKNKLTEIKTVIQRSIWKIMTSFKTAHRFVNIIQSEWQSFETPEQAVVRSKSAAIPTCTSQTHGRSPDSLLCDKDALLTKARTWSDDQALDWTQRNAMG